MKLNMELYTEDIDYDRNISVDEEKDIIEYITDEKYNKDDHRINIFNNISEIRENIINWYPIKKDAEVLEIGGFFGSVTKILSEKCKSVTTLEFKKNRAMAISKRLENLDNVEVICAKLKDLNENNFKKFDYITLFDVIDYSNSIIQDFEISETAAVRELLSYVKMFLKENGKILIATNNKFGIKYFAGSKYLPCMNYYDSIIGRRNTNHVKGFSKFDLEKILFKCDMKNYKFYYPLPDFKLTNVIFSDEYVPSENNSKLKYNIYYGENDTIIMNELEAIKQIVKSSKLDFFSNSFFIEVGQELSDIRFVSFNNMRKDKYRLITKMYKDRVEKESIFDEGNSHIKSIEKNLDILSSLGFNTIDKVINGTVISEFKNENTLDDVIVKDIIDRDFDSMYKKIDKWYEYICKLLIQTNEIENNNVFEKYNVKFDINDNLYSNLKFVKHGFIDLIFENIFVINDICYLYDQEWYEENVPSEYILYRAINSLYYHNPKVHNILVLDKLYERYNLTNYIPLFDELESRFQATLVNDDIVKFYESTYSRTTTLENLASLEKQIEENKKHYEMVKNELENVIIKKDEEILKLRDKLEKSPFINYSKIWRKK